MGELLLSDATSTVECPASDPHSRLVNHVRQVARSRIPALADAFAQKVVRLQSRIEKRQFFSRWVAKNVGEAQCPVDLSERPILPQCRYNRSGGGLEQVRSE